MTPALIAAFLVAPACGLPLVLTLVPPLAASRAGWAIALTAGGGLGFGLLSLLHLLALTAGLQNLLPLIDLAAAAALWGLYAWRRRGTGPAAPPAPSAPWTRGQALLAGAAGLQALAASGTFLLAFLREPHGRWDAWLIWNLHARFLFRGGEGWREAFASGLDWSHWDYPLLLPLTVARGWVYQGGEGLASPALTAFGFTLLTAGLLAAGLALLRGRTAASLAAMALLGTPFFLFMGAAQFADVPLAFFLLVTLLALAARPRFPACGNGLLILAGLAAGLAAWTKNEGLLFALAAAAALGGAALLEGPRAALRRLAAFGAGALVPLAAVLWFKLTLAPPNDILAGIGPASLAGKLLDGERYATIARAFAVVGLSFAQGVLDVNRVLALNLGPAGPLLLGGYLLVAGVRPPREERPALTIPAAILGLMLAGYFTTFLLTYQELAWHLATSLNRLFLQLWPGAILLAFLVARTGDALPAAAAAVPSSGPARAAAPPRGRKPSHPKEAT